MKAFDLPCQGIPTDKQTAKAKKFGEGFTWTCPRCFMQYILVQGKGNYFYWRRKRE